VTTPRGASEMASGDAAGRRRRFRFRLVSPTGAPVVAPGRLDQRSRLGAMLPSLFTLVNLLCGFSSILASIDGQYRHAAALIAVAILFDIADGAVARAVGAITPFGLQFDSLADLTSFGMAPALLLYNRSLDDMYWVGWVAAGLWIACAAFRLARFNVTIDPHADKKYFIGLASPGAAGGGHRHGVRVRPARRRRATVDPGPGGGGARPLDGVVVPVPFLPRRGLTQP
jgi:CDP-diacylglycerol--serine O-phosphatidyltransferase